jgi:hypothetical protein
VFVGLHPLSIRVVRMHAGVDMKLQKFRLWDARIVVDTKKMMDRIYTALKSLGKDN